MGVSVNSLQCANRGHGSAGAKDTGNRPPRVQGEAKAQQEATEPTESSIHSTTNHCIKSGQISHGEKFEERKDSMSRIGKIARLPLAIREQLNRRLQDGEIGKDLVVWLNSVPEVQAVLKAEFGDRPVNEPNLSDWRTGGYEDWRVHQDTMQQVNQLVANAKELGGASQTPLSELLATCLAARYAVELSRLTAPVTPREGTRPTGEAEGNGGCDFEVLRKLCRDVLALRRLDLAGQRLRIEREAADRLLRADEKQQKKEWVAAANAAVEREHRRERGLIWRKEHQNDPAYDYCCIPLSADEEAYLADGEEPEEEQS